MENFQNENYYQLKELQNLLNYFERAFPIIEKNINNFDIKEIKDKCYLAWIAGMNFHNNEDISFLQKIVQDLLFKNIYESLNIKNFSLKSILFIYFSLGLITITNYSNKKKEYYKEYLPIISKGAVILDTVKFDRYVNGYRFWDISTLSKYINSKSKNFDKYTKSLYKEDITEEVSSRVIN